MRDEQREGTIRETKTKLEKETEKGKRERLERKVKRKRKEISDSFGVPLFPEERCFTPETDKELVYKKCFTAS